MTPVEIIALIIVVIGVVKLITIMINPHAWLNFAGKLWASPTMLRIIALILGGVILYYLLAELTIVQVFASTAFATMLLWLGFAPYKKELFEMISHDREQNILRKNWLLTVVWLVLALWVLKDIFGL